jgi:hypothetical protein
MRFAAEILKRAFMKRRSRQVATSFFAAAMMLCSPVIAGAQTNRANDIPPGTQIRVRMIDSLNSAKAGSGDIFHATLEDPIVVKGKELYPHGADVTGTVAAVHPSGRLSEPGELTLILNTVSSGSAASSLTVQPLQIKGESHGKSNATKIGGGAVLGAIIGGIAGGGKGAAIGAGAGGAAGTGAAAATGKREAMVDSEALLDFTTTDVVASPNSTSGGSTATSSSEPSSGAGPALTSTPPPSAADRPSDRPSGTGVSGFTARDMRVIRNCVSEHASDLPASATQPEELPAGSDRQVRVGSTLPLDVQKKVQPLPLACEDQLPRLARDQERVLYTGRVLLLDGSSKIVDMFPLSSN